MLTDRAVRNLKTGLHADGGGLYLRVSPKGKKVWVKRTQVGGKERKVSLGTYPGMSLADARRKAQGVVAEVTMSAALATYKAKLEVRRPEQIDWLMDALEPKTLTVTRAELVSMLQEKAKGSPVMANRMLTRWKDFFNFCEQQGWVEGNPLAIVQRKFVGGKEKHRERTLSRHEINELFVKHFVKQPALIFVLLTGLRPSEALGVLRTKRTDGIPTKQNPQGSHWIPRTPLVRWALNRDIVVPSTHLTLSNYLRRQKATYTPHDLRRTFSTMLNELGVEPWVVEKMLDHKLPGVMATYNHAEYRAERIAAQRLWDKTLIRLWRNGPVPDTA
jgi:integrase